MGNTLVVRVGQTNRQAFEAFGTRRLQARRGRYVAYYRQRSRAWEERGVGWRYSSIITPHERHLRLIERVGFLPGLELAPASL